MKNVRCAPLEFSFLSSFAAAPSSLFMIILWDVNVMLWNIYHNGSSYSGDYKILSPCHNDSCTNWNIFVFTYMWMSVCIQHNGHLLTPSIFIEYVNLSKERNDRGEKNFFLPFSLLLVLIPFFWCTWKSFSSSFHTQPYACSWSYTKRSSHWNKIKKESSLYSR